MELCGHILDHHDDGVDVVNFRSVCKDWVNGAKVRNRNRIPVGALVLITSGLRAERVDVANDDKHGGFGLHDIGVEKSYYGNCDGLKNRAWVGGKDSWLVTTDIMCNVEVFNVITSTRIALPSFTMIPDVHVPPVHSRSPGVCFNTLFEMILNGQTAPDGWVPDLQLRKIALCQTPDNASGYQAVALFSSWFPFQMVAVIEKTLQKWSRLKEPDEPMVSRFTDVCVLFTKVMAVTKFGDVWSGELEDVTDSEPELIRGPVTHIDRDVDDYVFYLAKCRSGVSL